MYLIIELFHLRYRSILLKHDFIHRILIVILSNVAIIDFDKFSLLLGLGFLRQVVHGLGFTNDELFILVDLFGSLQF